MSTIDRILELSKQKGIKQTFMCERLSVDNSYFRTVKKQNSTIPTERLERIADILGTTVEYLNGETDNPEKEKSSSDLDELLNDPEFMELFRAYKEMPESKKKLVHALFSAVKNEV